MAKHRYFIAGTDTDAGKTTVACGLLAAANGKGWSSAACKPVAAGCEDSAEGLRNQDALLLSAAMSLSLPYEQVNPVALREPIAPHIAAIHERRTLSASRLAGYCNGVLMQGADFTLIEGAGGWRVPLNPRETLATLAQELSLPVILVVGFKLGCINHALLTAEAIAADGLHLAGWVGNCVDGDMACRDENLTTLKTLLKAPCLGVVPRLPKPQANSVAEYLSLTPLSA